MVEAIAFTPSGKGGIGRVLWRPFETFLAWLPALMLVAPLALLALGAFAETWDSRGPRGFTTETFASAWTFARHSAFFSLWIAGLTAAIAVALAVPAAYLLSLEPTTATRLLRPALSLPLVVPSLLLAMGLIIAFPAWQGTWQLLLLAYVTQCLPFAIWPVATALTMIDMATLETAGRTLGASQRQRFLWLVLPNVTRPAAVGASTVFVLVLAESSSSFFLASGRYQPFGVTLYNAFQDLDLRIAAATTMILVGMLTPAILVLEVWLGAPGHPASSPRTPRNSGAALNP
jgi:ABC-type spermidine/putrescine transport system permease subunit II